MVPYIHGHGGENEQRRVTRENCLMSQKIFLCITEQAKVEWNRSTSIVNSRQEEKPYKLKENIALKFLRQNMVGN